MSLTLKRDPALNDDAFYLVYEDGVAAGRIFRRLAGTGATEDATWFWGVTFKPKWERPTYGTAETREAAMAAFKARWERGGPD